MSVLIVVGQRDTSAVTFPLVVLHPVPGHDPPPDAADVCVGVVRLATAAEVSSERVFRRVHNTIATDLCDSVERFSMAI